MEDIIYAKVDSIETSTCTQPDNTLTAEKIRESIQLAKEIMFPVLYYASNKYVEKGKCYHVKETSFNPEYVVFNSEDLEEAIEFLKHKWTLKHIKEYNLEEEMKKNFEKTGWFI